MNAGLTHKARILSVAATVAIALSNVAHGQALPGGTIDPLSIPKYVTPLVIPPVMNNSGEADDYNIAVRQFQQQILPGGIWNAVTGRNDQFPATTIWSYGPAEEDRAAVAALVAPHPSSQFNYPAYTIEATSNKTVTVDWINDLVDPATGDFRPHLLAVDRTLHWANPEGLTCNNTTKGKDCRPSPSAPENAPFLQEPYDGPVPIVVHVHGAHVGPESDGYPEAWWLPDAGNIPGHYQTRGSLVNQYGVNTNGTPGVGSFTYPNTQPSTTLWYHDHTLGMTRNNVYAGPAGFWLLRENGGGETGLGAATTLPAPAPVAGDTVGELNAPAALGEPDKRSGIREIPIVIQDRAFNTDGSLFYPANRAFFEGLGDGQDSAGNGAAGLNIDFFGQGDSDIAPIWNPEAFFNVMVVNGVSWPEFEVAPAIYRLRLLNGSNSRFLNLALVQISGKKTKEMPFYQIGAEQSLMPQVVRIETGFATPLPGDGSDVDWKYPACVSKKGKPRKNCVIPQVAPFAEQAMLMGLAERADVLVDFRGRSDGDIIRMINTAPDSPFGGWPDVAADPATTGQVMQFRINSALLGASPTDPVLADGTPNPNAATDPTMVQLSLPDAGDPAHTGIGDIGKQDLALLEEESLTVCVTINGVTGVIDQVAGALPTHVDDQVVCVDDTGVLPDAFPFGPKAAVLGTSGSAGGDVQLWADPMRQNPDVGATEEWELWNWSADAHPIHLHLVKFKVVNREAFDPVDGKLLGPVPSSAHEKGWKDTVIAYPGEVTRVRATFDIPGLYVWHCHIVEHEDNEMMVPFCVGNGPGCSSHEAAAAMDGQQ